MTDNYVLLELITEESPNKKNLEHPGGAELKTTMGGGKAGLPFFFIVDKEGNKLADSLSLPGGKNIGHPASPEEIKAFDVLLEKTAPRLTKEQRAKIADYLTKNAPH